MRRVGVILGALTCAATAFAQQSQLPAAQARFQVSGYAVQGRLLLRSEDFTRVVSPYVGRGKSAADIEAARRALEDTYHHLGHCAVRVGLAQPEPKDGMVTFVVSEAPVGEVRDCLPTVVLDEPARASAPAGDAPRAPTAYSYADPREPAAPALKPRAAAVPPAVAVAPRGAGVAPASAAPPARTEAPLSPAAGSTQAAVRTGEPGVVPGVATAPYVQGAGAKGLSVMSDSPTQEARPPVVAATAPATPPPAVVVPVAPPVEAKLAASPTVVAAEPVKPAPALPVEAQPRAAAPVVAAVEPSKPAPAAGAAEAKLSTPAPVAAAVEPAKPAPVTPAPAVTTAETKPTVAAAGPAKPVLATPAATAAAEAKRVAVAPPVPVVVAAEPVKSAPTSVVTAEPVKSARASSDPSLEKTRAPAAVPAVAVVQPMKPDYVLAEAKNPTDGRSSFVGTAGTLPAAQPASTTPAIAVTVGAAQPVADRAEPAKPAPAAAASATTPTAVLAQAEPVKPAAPKPAPAAEPEASGAPKFTISRYAVEGSTLLKQQDIDRALAPFTGPGKDFGDVQRALEALQLTYQKEGYGGVEIRLPEQELEKGEVKLRVIEPKIAKITVEGNEYFTEANVRRSVPALKEGETPNSREIGKSVRLANENPSKQSAVLLRASEREDQLDATIRVSDVDPKRYSVSLDNTGNSETHYERLGLAFQHSNMFGLDQVLTAQFITAPLNYHDVTVFGVGYRIPLYSFGDSLDLVAGYSNVDSGTVQNLFVVSGQGAVYAVRYNQNLPRWGDLEHRFSYGFDYRAYQNDVKPTNGDTKLVPDITVHPVTLTYSGSWRAENKGELSYYASMLQNIPGGNDGRDDNFKAVGARFPDGTASYRLFRTGVTYARPIVADWQVRIRADGQYTEDALVSPEMFAIGGADSVRGFNERYVANDKGYRTSWELYTPDTAKAVGLDGRLRFLAFYDQGVVKRNKIQPGELSQQSLDSAGVGLRLNYKTNLTVRLDVAYVYHDGTSTNGKDGQTRGHIAMAWVW